MHFKSFCTAPHLWGKDDLEGLAVFSSTQSAKSRNGCRKVPVLLMPYISSRLCNPI